MEKQRPLWTACDSCSVEPQQDIVVNNRLCTFERRLCA